MPAKLSLPKSAALLAALLLAACATPAQRITTNLVDLGVNPGQAQCMGNRLGERLSLGQLRRLQQLTGLRSERFGRMSIREIAGRLNDDRDPGLVAEFLRAGVGCLI
ncbi:hypothetical protein [Sandarakinorhabdus sp.]|uniref:hypothetical protein n=1 Tax=Sandarakinorhabdus sp. TaxID=1916663 RepID=UPI00356A309D